MNESTSMSKITITERKKSSKPRSTWIPKSAANPGLFLCQNAEMKCTMELKAIPSVQPLLMTEKLQDISNQQLILASMGRAHNFRAVSTRSKLRTGK